MASDAVKTQMAEIITRVLANAAIIWGGREGEFDLDFETDNYSDWYAVLSEYCGQSIEPRTLTVSSYPSRLLAVQALDRELAHRVGLVLARRRELKQR
jgi:hypothetical protein